MKQIKQKKKKHNLPLNGLIAENFVVSKVAFFISFKVSGCLIYMSAEYVARFVHADVVPPSS